MISEIAAPQKRKYKKRKKKIPSKATGIEKIIYISPPKKVLAQCKCKRTELTYDILKEEHTILMDDPYIGVHKAIAVLLQYNDMPTISITAQFLEYQFTIINGRKAYDEYVRKAGMF